jgi:hypothetical protein
VSLIERIESDLLDAMKTGSTEKVSVLRMLKSSIKNAEIESSDELTEGDILKILEKQAKQRKDSIALYVNGGRQDLAKKEEAELDIINLYLPEKLSREEVLKTVSGAIQDTGASTMKDMGLVIKTVMEKVGDQTDGKTVSDIVKEKLA